MGWGDKIIGNWFGEAAAPPAPTPPPQSQAERDAERIANLKIAEEKAAPFLEFAERLKNIPPDADGKIFRLEMRDRSFAEVSLAVVFGPGGDRGPRSSWEYSSLTVTIAHDRIRVSDYNDEGAGPFDKRCKTVDEAIVQVSLWAIDRAPQLVMKIDTQPPAAFAAAPAAPKAQAFSA